MGRKREALRGHLVIEQEPLAGCLAGAKLLTAEASEMGMAWRFWRKIQAAPPQQIRPQRQQESAYTEFCSLGNILRMKRDSQVISIKRNRMRRASVGLNMNRNLPVRTQRIILAGMIAWGVASGGEEGVSSAWAAAPAGHVPIRPAAATNQMAPRAMQLFQAGRFDDARKMCDELIRRGGKDRDVQEAFYLKGKCLQALSEYQEAIECWKNLLDRYADTDWDEEVLMDMGRAYIVNLNQPDKAILQCERLIRNYPRSKRVNEAQYHLGMAAYMTGDYRKARTAFDGVLAKDPQGRWTKEAREWLSQTITALNSLAASRPGKSPDKEVQPVEKKSNPRDDIPAAIANAENIQAKGDTKEAAMAFQRIVKNNTWSPGYDRALFRLGQCQAALGEEERAIGTWEEVLKLARRKLSCDYADDSLLAQAEIWLNVLCNPDKALDSCQALVKEYPQSALIPQAEHLIGLVCFQNGEWDKAKAIFDRELAKVPRPADTNAPPSELDRLIAACRVRQAGGIYIKSLARADPLIRMGDMQFIAGKYDKARRTYEKAVRESPGTESAAYALLQAGRCCNQLRRYRDALRCYDRFLTSYQESQYADEALLRAGVIYVGPLHDMTSGAKMYTILLERYPKSNEAETAQYHLATLAYWKKDWDRALALYRQVAETWPDGRYADFIVTRKMPELMSWLKAKCITKGDNS